MSHSVALGQARFQTKGSNIHLHLGASANIRLSPSSHGTDIPVALEKWLDEEDIWITEAPELELRFFVRTGPSLDAAISTFISQLGDKLCDSTTWSDLGFAATLKSCDHTHGSCLVFGLRRRTEASNIARGRSVPIKLRNPPDAYPPSNIPSASLVSVDIGLEYSCQSEHGQRHRSPTVPSENSQISVSTGLQQYSQQGFIGTGAETENPASSGNAFSRSASDHTLYLPSSSNFYSFSQGTTNNQLTQDLLQLLDFGLQRLTISASIKDPQIQEFGTNTLQNLSKIAPAVFSPGYRDEMNQRAILIQILSKSLFSMAINSNNSTIQSKLSALSQKASLTPFSTGDMKSAIEASFWRISQKNLRRPYISRRKPKPFFATTASDTHSNTDENAYPSLFAQSVHLENDLPESDDILFDHECEVDDYDDCFWEILEEDSQEESMRRFFDDESEGSFMDIGEPASLPHPPSDTEMLLAEHEKESEECASDLVAGCGLLAEIDRDDLEMLCE